MQHYGTDLRKEVSLPAIPTDVTLSSAHLGRPAQASVTLDTYAADNWTAITADLFSPQAPVNAEALVSLICSEGGRVAILSRHVPAAEDSYSDEATKEEYSLAQAQAQQLAQRFPDNIAVLPVANSGNRVEYWSRDMGGLFTAEGNKVAQIKLKLPNAAGSYMELVEHSIREKRELILGTEIDEISLGLLAVQGELVFIGSDTVLLTNATRKKNAHLSEEQLIQELALIGRPRVLVVPEIARSCYHADFNAVQVNETVFIPELDARAIRHWSNTEYGPLLDILQKSKNTLCTAGLNPVGLPMPVPPMLDAPPCLLSPVNLTQLRLASEKLVVLVPWPANQPLLGPPRFSSEFTKEWLDTDLHSVYQETIRERLQAAGVDVVHFVPVKMQPTTSGLLHCVTKELPDSLVQKLLKL